MGEALVTRRGGEDGNGFLASTAKMGTLVDYGRPSMTDNTWVAIASIPRAGVKKIVGIITLGYYDVPSVFILTKNDEEFYINPFPNRPQVGIGLVYARLHLDDSNYLLQGKQVGGTVGNYPYFLYGWAIGN